MQKNLLSVNQSLYLPNGQKIILNEQQLEAVSAINKFLKTKDTYFLLSGFAGTGKTTVVKKVLDDYSKKSIVSAPTRKANAVISQATATQGYTIHSLLGLQPDISLDDFNPNDPVFGQINKASIHRYNLVVIDEASMINQNLFDLIGAEAKKSISTKVLFLGDEAQIPPINGGLSPIFELKNKYNLTMLMRQSENNPLVELCKQFRDGSNSFPKVLLDRENLLNDAEQGILFIESKEAFRAQLKKVFDSDYAKTDVNYTKLIAWRNKSVMQSNKIIRSLIFGENASIVEKGDVLTGYRAIKAKIKESFLINNCVDYKVLDVSKKQKNINGIYGYTVKILEKSKIFRGFDEKSIFIIDSQDENNIHDYADIHDQLLLTARADRLWSVYYEFRKNNLLMLDISTYRDGKIRSKENVIKKDLDYGFAVTAHKAQGSTYKKVFVLLKDIMLNKNINERNQVLYVALTRARDLNIVL